jgi:pyridoxal phosphate enzyme (YggS family)
VVDSAALRARLTGVRDRIARAAGRAGRDPASIRLIAVSKTISSDHVRAAADAGQIDFGENKVQEALEKMDATADLRLRWHLIGHLQSNKAKKCGVFHAIHSIDDEDLLGRLDAAAQGASGTVRGLIQVDFAREPTKHGAPVDRVAPLMARAASCRALRLCGLMVLPPATDDPEDARPHFAALRNLRDRLVTAGGNPGALAELSMGMSHDFEVAVEEGATMVRVGSAVFGERTDPAPAH